MDHPKLGRRGGLLLFFSAAVVAIILGLAWPTVATASSMVGTFGAEAAFALVYLQAQELYPTAIRGSALGLFSCSARVSTLIAAPLPILVRLAVRLERNAATSCITCLVSSTRTRTCAAREHSMRRCKLNQVRRYLYAILGAM